MARDGLKHRVYVREWNRRKRKSGARRWNADSYLFEPMLDFEWRKKNALGKLRSK